jgi:hypothetical protein
MGERETARERERELNETNVKMVYGSFQGIAMGLKLRSPGS